MNLNPAKPKPEREHNERQDWLIVLLILLIGLCGVTGAGQYALRFVPSWQLDADMGSNLDLNSEFLTSKPIAYFEPVDPAILTQPAWVNGNVFLTPGAGNSLIKNSTPLPTSDASTSVPTVMGTTTVPTIPGVVTNTVVPTSTLIWYPPPATKTSKPGGPAPTNTSPAPLPSANLGIAQSDGTTSYVAGDTLTYTMTVTNTGPSNVNGATVTNTFTAQVTGASWSCAAVGTVCGAGGPGTINDVVNLPVGSSITYTVNVNINAGASGNLLHTVSVSLPAGYTGPSPVSATDTNTASTATDLWVTKDDNVIVYAANDTLTYTVTVGNNGPSNATSALVEDNIPAQIADWTWTCNTPGVNGCDGAANNSSNFSDTVDLPSGASITYTVTAHIVGSPSDNLSNIVTVSSSTDPVPGNNTWTDPTDVLAGPPPGSIGTYDSTCTTLNAGGPPIIFSVSAAIDDDADPDLIYYEEPNGIGILMDEVIIEISDGLNWYTLLNWGDDQPNNGTNLPSPADELDDYPINAGTLHNNTGILLYVPASLQNGPISYIRITIPPESIPNDGNACIDALVPY